MEVFFHYVVTVLSYVSIVCIIFPWCGVPDEPSGSWFLDHFFALMTAATLAAFAIGIGLATSNHFGLALTWKVIAGIVLTVSGCGVAYLRWLR